MRSLIREDLLNFECLLSDEKRMRIGYSNSGQSQECSLNDEEPIGSFSPLGGKTIWLANQTTFPPGGKTIWLVPHCHMTSQNWNSQFSLVPHYWVNTQVWVNPHRWGKSFQNDINIDRNVWNIISFPRNSEVFSYFINFTWVQKFWNLWIFTQYFFSSQRQSGYPFRSSN